MNYEHRSDLVRLIAGSLLTSVRSERELRMITGVLETEPNLMGEVAEMLRAVLMVSGASMTKLPGTDKPPPHPLAEAAYQAIQRQKITRSQLLDELISVNPRIDAPRLKGVSIRDILQRFFAVASVSEGTKLLKRLDINMSQDPYLRGINER